jgi:hypothetical protein
LCELANPPDFSGFNIIGNFKFILNKNSSETGLEFKRLTATEVGNITFQL